MWIYSYKGRNTNNITYTKRDLDFSGHIFFTNLNENFINGYVYENGKITKASGPKLSSRTSTRMQPLQEGCNSYEIYNYERICDYYNDGTVECTEWQFIGSTTETYCYGGGSGNGEYDDENYTQTNVDENQSIIDSLQGYPCAQNLLKEMPKVNDQVKQILYDVFGINDDVNIMFTPANLADDIDGATTCGGSSNFFNCTVKINTLILNGSVRDYIAATLIHEAIHAYINYQRTVLPPDTFNTRFPIFGNYIGNDPHHNEMANNYVNIMASVISGLNPNLSTFNSQALAWGGLDMTTAWRNNPDTNAIKLVNTAARTPMPKDYIKYGFKNCDSTGVSRIYLNR
jgi:hypothetical protein